MRSTNLELISQVVYRFQNSFYKTIQFCQISRLSQFINIESKVFLNFLLKLSANLIIANNNNNKSLFKSLSYTSTFYNGIEDTEGREMWLVIHKSHPRNVPLLGVELSSSCTVVFCAISCASATSTIRVKFLLHFFPLT